MAKGILGKWDYSKIEEACYSDPKCESYIKGAEYLGDSCEDWGGGTGWAGKYFKEYRNVEGSAHKNVDEIADLAEYTSDVDNIFMRQVLETNKDWRKILDNVKKSFKKKFCLVVYTPEVEVTKVGSTHIPVDGNNNKMEGILYEIHFNRQDIRDCFPDGEFKVSEEVVKTKQGYGEDWIFYVERK